jgi:hypothetical protein
MLPEIRTKSEHPTFKTVLNGGLANGHNRLVDGRQCERETAALPAVIFKTVLKVRPEGLIEVA